METRKFKVLKGGAANPNYDIIWNAERLSDVGGALNLLETGKIENNEYWHLTGPSGDIKDPIDDIVSEETLNTLLADKSIEEIKEEF